MTRIGVLALQGDFFEHIKILRSLNVDTLEIRLPAQLDSIDGLIIPGGESTTIVQLIDIYKFREKLIKTITEGLPTWGTCAGLIVLAKKLMDHRPDPLKLMDITVQRNAFGRQVDSFESNIDITGVEGPPFNCIFIRAPIVTQVGKNTEILAKVNNNRAVAVKEKNILGTSFHPELTKDTRVPVSYTHLTLPTNREV